MTEKSNRGFMMSGVAGLGRKLPYIGIAVVTIAFVVVAGLGRLDLGIRGLYLAVPIIVASVWLIRKKRISHIAAEEAAPSLPLSGLRFTHLTLLNALIFIIGIILLLGSETRPPAYFVLMAAFYGIVFVQILGTAGGSGLRRGIILGQLVVLALSLIWSRTLHYPLFVGATDIPAHLRFIESILQSSHITDTMRSYQYFPLYHVFLASGVDVLGMNLRDGFFVLGALAYVPTILFAYLFFKAITGSERLSLMACLLFAVNGEFIYYGGYMVTRALAFVFFLAILYLLFRQPRTAGTVAMLALFTATLILTHQTTLAYISVILGLFVGLQWLMARSQPSSGSQTCFASIYLAIFVGAFVSYWLLGTGGFVEGVVRQIGPSDVIGIPPASEAGVPEAALPTIAEALASVRDHAANMIFLLLAWVGLAYLLRRAGDQRHAATTAVALLGLVCLVLYLPNPVHLLPQLNNVFLAYRIPLLLAVFMSLVMSYGMVVLAKGGPLKKATIPILITATVAFSFLSMTCLKNAADVPEFRNPYFGERRYFTAAELHALSFVEEQAPQEIPLYSGYLARRYFVDRPARIIICPDIGYIEEGYVLLRTGELADRWLLFSGARHGLMVMLYKYKLDAVEPADSILEHLASQDKMYDNETTGIYAVTANATQFNE